MPGMLRSIKTIAGWHLIANSTASRPDLAEIVSKPYRSKIHASSSRYSALSSTTKIKAFLFITPILRSTELLSHSCRLLLCHLTQLIEAGVEQIGLKRLKPEKESQTDTRKVIVLYRW